MHERAVDRHHPARALAQSEIVRRIYIALTIAGPVVATSYSHSTSSVTQATIEGRQTCERTPEIALADSDGERISRMNAEYEVTCSRQRCEHAHTTAVKPHSTFVLNSRRFRAWLHER